ncbi:MAG: dTDP-4-dehydrorhamnose 3,5-epimerase [Bauldia sp.]
MRFTATELDIPGLLLIGARRFADRRGTFMETWRASDFSALGLPAFVQDNQAYSAAAGTVRGLHFQRPPHAQAKLVRVVRGAIFDVAVDLRRDSPTFGKGAGIELKAETGEQIFVPSGFAHGYCTLVPDTDVVYRCDVYYSAEADAGVLWSDPAIAIAWPVDHAAAIVSDKDRALPRLADIASPFVLEPA